MHYCYFEKFRVFFLPKNCFFTEASKVFFFSCHSVGIFEINYRLCFNQNYDSKLPVSCNAVLCVAGWEGGLESFTMGGSKCQILLIFPTFCYRPVAQPEKLLRS